MLCYDAEIHQKANMEPSWNNTSVFLGNNEQILLEPLRAHGNSAQVYGTTYGLQEESARDGTLVAPSDPSKSTLQFRSSKHHRAKNAGSKMHQHDPRRKTLPQDYRRHLCVPFPSNRNLSMATHR